jgi:hypothetical protein
VLISTGLLALAGAFAVLRLLGQRRIRRLRDRLWAPLALAWVGRAVSFASGLSQYALAADAGPHPSTSLIVAIGAISGLLMGAVALVATSAARARSGASPKPSPTAAAGHRGSPTSAVSR